MTAARERLAQLDADEGEAFWNRRARQPDQASGRGRMGQGRARSGDARRSRIGPSSRPRPALLPAAPWDGTTWKAWTEAVKAATGVKGKALFMPLRLALTGLDHGPELGALLPLIGPERARARLAGQAA